MSIDVIGYVERVWGGIQKKFATLPSWLQTFVAKVGGQEGTILQGLVSAATSDLMQDIENPSQLTSAQIGGQAAAIFAQLVAQNVSTFTLQDVYAALNSSLSAKAPATATAVAAMAATPAPVIETPSGT